MDVVDVMDIIICRGDRPVALVARHKRDYVQDRGRPAGRPYGVVIILHLFVGCGFAAG